MVEVYVIHEHEKHRHPGHPESPQRIEWILRGIGRKPRVWKDADEELILQVHDPGYVEIVKRGTGWIDPDTYVTPFTYLVAARSATAAFHAPEESFLLTRPPGHHAFRERGSGFCIFNNAIFASLRDERVGILDVDAHHGNGTEALLPENAVYASIHMGAGYPGTGLNSTPRSLNIPVYYSMNDAEFIRLVQKAFRFFRREGVEFIVVSLGFDGLYEDPLSYFSLTPRAYFELGKLLREWNWKAVLEGGYSPLMGRAARAFLEGLENP